MQSTSILLIFIGLLTAGCIPQSAIYGDGPPPGVTEKLVMQGDVPVRVRWRESDRAQALAFGPLRGENALRDAAAAIEQATGCTARTRSTRFEKYVYTDGRGIGYRLGLDCSRPPARVQKAQGTAVAADGGALPDTVARQTKTWPAITGSPALFEGGRYADFTKDQIQAYCGQDWRTRIAPDGRTEYNPCKVREAYQ